MDILFTQPTSLSYGMVVLVLLEGEAYVIATLAALLHAQAWLWPARVGAQGHGAGYREGLRRNLALQSLVALQLLVAAAYEAAMIV